MAQVILRDLLESPGVEKVGVGDLDFAKVRRVARSLKIDRAVPTQVDVRETDRLVSIMKEWDVAVNSTWYQLNLPVMKAAIKAGIHYLDLGGLYHMTLKQLRFDREAKDAGITCILGIGSTPGTMNIMAAYGASKLSSIKAVKLRSGSATVKPGADVFQSPYAIRTVLDEFTMSPVVLRKGKLRKLPPLSGNERFVLPDPVGEVEGYYTIHSELATLPFTLNKGVQEMDFVVAYPHEFTKFITMLVKMGLASRNPVKVRGKDVLPYDVLATVVDSIPKPREVELDVDVQRVELDGEQNGRSVKLRYDAISVPHKGWKIGGGTVGTGVPPSIAAQWLAKGKIKVQGVVPPEQSIDPLAFFRELGARDRGIRVLEYAEEAKILS